MKSGTVAFVGRPNVGKSTLLNTIIGQKIAITSPKPQTTRFPIYGQYTEDRGSITFIDTPGIFYKTKDTLSKKINQKTLSEIEKEIDIFIYIIDPTRPREFEEGRVLGIVRKLKKPVIVVVNKSDIQNPPFMPQYEFLRDEYNTIIKISALKQKHIKTLLDAIFDLLPEKKNVKSDIKSSYPGLNIDSKTFLSELIREKIFLLMRKELPYTCMVIVDEVMERSTGMLVIKARILTTNETYKKMIIGTKGRQIKNIGSMARKEIELATNKKVYLELTVEIDHHWMEIYA